MRRGKNTKAKKEGVDRQQAALTVTGWVGKKSAYLSLGHRGRAFESTKRASRKHERS